MRWCLSHKYDPVAARLADRHYNRKTLGAPQFVPPGRCLVLLSDCARAFWITSWPFPEYVRHAWPGAWVCSAFRSEDAGTASQLIRDALAATRAHYGDPPAHGMVTFIDRRKVRPIMVRGAPTWGYSWRKAGFREVAETKRYRLQVMQILPDDMPPAAPARPRSMHGAPLFDSVAMPAATILGVASPSTVR